MTADVPSSLIRAMAERAERDPGGIAYRHEHHGIWPEVTWGEVRARVERSTAALLGLGVQAGDKVVFLVPPSPHWFCLDLAVQAVGAVPLALYESFPDEGLVDLLEEHGPRILVVHEAETFERIRGLGALPTVRHVLVVANARRERSSATDDVMVQTLDDVMAAAEPGQDAVDLVERGGRDAPVLALTAGTTGRPETIVWTAGDLEQAARRWVDGTFTHAGKKAPSSRDRVVAELPVAHIAGRLLLGVLPVTHGIVVHYPERVGGSISTRRVAAPTLSVAPARVWQLVAEGVDRAVSTSGRVRRGLLTHVLRSRRRSTAASERSRHPLELLYRWCVIRPAMRKLGLSSLRSAQVVEGPLPPSLVEFWRSWGVDLAECYATAELGVVATGVPRPDDGDDDRWLELYPGIAAMTDPEGQLHLRRHDRTETSDPHEESVALEEGWKPSGDIGLVEGSRIRILGPASDALRLPAGEYLPAFDMEAVISESRYVRAANAYVSSGRPSAVVEPAIGALRDDLGPVAVAALNRGEIMADPRVVESLRSELAAANERLALRGLPAIRRFLVLPGELDPVAGDPVTPTRKLRRAEAAALESRGMLVDFDEDGSTSAVRGQRSNERLPDDDDVENREVRA